MAESRDRTEQIIRAFLQGCGGSATEDQIVTATMAFEKEYAHAQLTVAVYELVLDGEAAFVIKDGACAFLSAPEKKSSRVRMKIGANEMEAAGDAGAVTDAMEAFGDTIAPAGTRVKVPLVNPDVLKCSRVGCLDYAIWRTFTPGRGSRSDRYRCAGHIGDVPDHVTPPAAEEEGRELSIDSDLTIPEDEAPVVISERRPYPKREPYGNGGNNQLQPEKQEELVALLRDGRWSTNDIATKLDISHVTVIRYRKLHGISPRKDRGGYWAHKSTEDGLNRRAELTEEAREKLARQGIHVG